MALQCAAYKAKKASDPDYPSVRQALTGPNAELWWDAMDKELQSIIDMDSWEIVPRSSVPKGTKIIPGTWALRLKRFPDGRVNKFKARYCVMGSVMPKGTENWSPVVGWPTVWASLLLAASNNWHTQSVDITNAFCQASYEGSGKDPLYIECPPY